MDDNIIVYIGDQISSLRKIDFINTYAELGTKEVPDVLKNINIDKYYIILEGVLDIEIIKVENLIFILTNRPKNLDKI